MASKESSNNDEWVEVKFIDGYALLVGYLSMGVRGLAFLVVTWTTVVLLGGFVSMLEKKDFWCLTVITLAQTAGVFNVRQNEKLSYIWKSRRSFFSAMQIMVTGCTYKGRMNLRTTAGGMVVVVKLLAFAIVLCPLCAIYMCGLYISAGISLWRLIQHDYHSSDGDPNKANMNPALDVLYSLALVQGLLFCYKEVLSFAEKRLVSEVGRKYGLGDQECKSVTDYLCEIKIECAKDPSLARRRNVITYAVELMDSKSPDSYHSGAKILDTVIRRPNMIKGDHELIKHLVGSASSNHILQKLLHTLDSSSPHDKEIRESAARIVAYLASDIRLAKFRRGVQCVSSLLVTSLQEYDDSAKAAGHKNMLLQGLLILSKLAADEDNCKVISSNEGLLAKITAPVSSDLLHRSDHDKWSSIVDASLKVLYLLITAPGNTGAAVSAQISSKKEAIETLKTIVDCPECGKVEKRHIRAINILTQSAIESRGEAIKKLIDIFTDENRGCKFRELAGDSLVTLSFDTTSAKIIFEEIGYDARVLITILLLDNYKTNRTYAAQVLEGLCTHYAEHDGILDKLKDAMTNAMPEVLREILYLESTEQETRARRALYSKQAIGIGGQHGVSQDSGSDSSSYYRQDYDEQHEDRKLLVALLSLYTTACDKLALPFVKIAPANDEFIFILPTKLKEMVERNSYPSADCLRILKHISKVVISMVTHGSGYVKEDMNKLVESLSGASKDMLDLDGLMLFSGDDGAINNPVKTLTSLVEEAKEFMRVNTRQQLWNDTGVNLNRSTSSRNPYSCAII